MKLLLILFCALVFAGCATCNKGSFALIDIDTRTAEQIQAANENQDITGLKFAPLSWWEELFKLIPLIKGRLRILPFDYQSADVPIKPHTNK